MRVALMTNQIFSIELYAPRVSIELKCSLVYHFFLLVYHIFVPV